MGILLFGLGLPEIGVLFLVVLFFFGGPKIKEVVGTFRDGYKEVNNMKSEFKKEVGDNLKDLIK